MLDENINERTYDDNSNDINYKITVNDDELDSIVNEILNVLYINGVSFRLSTAILDLCKCKLEDKCFIKI